MVIGCRRSVPFLGIARTTADRRSLRSWATGRNPSHGAGRPDRCQTLAQAKKNAGSGRTMGNASQRGNPVALDLRGCRCSRFWVDNRPGTTLRIVTVTPKSSLVWRWAAGGRWMAFRTPSRDDPERSHVATQRARYFHLSVPQSLVAARGKGYLDRICRFQRTVWLCCDRGLPPRTR
jgi:hypothetical protein